MFILEMKQNENQGIKSLIKHLEKDQQNKNSFLKKRENTYKTNEADKSLAYGLIKKEKGINENISNLKGDIQKHKNF